MLSSTLRSLAVLGPSNDARSIAMRAALSVVLPLLVLDATGHLSWTMYAAFGAFTALYGRERIAGHRVRLQLVAAGWLIGCVSLGALIASSDHRAWLTVPAAAAVAAGAAYRSSVEGWHPPGSLFQVFAVAAVASVPGRTADVVPAFLVSAACALLAVMLGNVGAWVRRTRHRGPATGAAPIGGSVADAGRAALLAGLGVVVAGSVANALAIGRPYWAMVSAVVPLAARALPAQVMRGTHRLVGTALGLVVAWLLLELDLRGVVLILAIGVLQAVAELVVGRNYALALLFITPLALLMGNVVRPAPHGPLLIDRAVETLIGVLLGVTIGWLLRPRTAGSRATSTAG